MICKKCNSKIEVPAKFCVYCGAPLEEVESTATINPVESVVTPPMESSVAPETSINAIEPEVSQPIEISAVESTINPIDSTVVQPVEVNVETKPVEVNVTEFSNQSTGVGVANEIVASVGDSTSNVEKTKSKKNNTWIIVVLVILVLGLGGYLVYDKVIDKIGKEEVKEESDKKN